MLSYRYGKREIAPFLEEHLNTKSDSEPRPEIGEHIMQYSHMQDRVDIGNLHIQK